MKPKYLSLNWILSLLSFISAWHFLVEYLSVPWNRTSPELSSSTECDVSPSPSPHQTWFFSSYLCRSLRHYNLPIAHSRNLPASAAHILTHFLSRSQGCNQACLNARLPGNSYPVSFIFWDWLLHMLQITVKLSLHQVTFFQPPSWDREGRFPF